MWRNKKRPTPEQLVVPDDVGEAIALREVATAEIEQLEKADPVIARLATGLIERRPKNHYLELLHLHARGAS